MATRYWTGSTNDGKWDTAGNWSGSAPGSPGGMPQTGDDVIFEPGHSAHPINTGPSAPISLASLSLYNSTQNTLSHGAKITVTGDCLVANDGTSFNRPGDGLEVGGNLNVQGGTSLAGLGGASDHGATGLNGPFTVAGHGTFTSAFLSDLDLRIAGPVRFQANSQLAGNASTLSILSTCIFDNTSTVTDLATVAGPGTLVFQGSTGFFVNLLCAQCSLIDGAHGSLVADWLDTGVPPGTISLASGSWLDEIYCHTGSIIIAPDADAQPIRNTGPNLYGVTLLGMTVEFNRAAEIVDDGTDYFQIDSDVRIVLKNLLQPADVAAIWAGAQPVSLAAGAISDVSFSLPSLSGVAAGPVGMLVQLWRRFFRKATKSATQLTTYADDGTTPITTQTVNDDGSTETQGAA
jgi:hypothetical protein